MRLQGEASLQDDDPPLKAHPEADLIVRVEVSELFINCPRYVHRYQKVEASRYVPRKGQETPLAEWKRIDALRDVLPERDRERAERAGSLTMDAYQAKLESGEG